MNAAVSPALATATGDARPLLAQVARNARWALAANAWYVACQAGVLLVVARQGSPAMVGQLALALAVAAPVQLLASLQLRSAQATDVAGDYAFGEYLSVRAAGALAAVVVVALLAWTLGLDGRVTVAVGVMKAIESLSDVAYGRLQRDQRYDRLGISQVVRGTLAVALAAAVLGGAAGSRRPCSPSRPRGWPCVSASTSPACRGSVACCRHGWARWFARACRSASPRASAASRRTCRAGCCGMPRTTRPSATSRRSLYVVVIGALLASALGQAVCPLRRRAIAPRRRASRG